MVPEDEVTGHIPTARKLVLRVLPPFYSVQAPTLVIALPTVTVGVPTSVSPL